jgi:hypothetical protein
MHNNYNEIPSNWLEIEIMKLISYPVVLEEIGFFGTNKQKTCICQFVTEYNANGSIAGWLSKPVSSNNSKKIFEPMKFIGQVDDERCKNPSNHSRLDGLDGNSDDDIDQDSQTPHSETSDSTRNALEQSSSNVSKSLYKLKGSKDIWKCHDCFQNGDLQSMIDHAEHCSHDKDLES